MKTGFIGIGNMGGALMSSYATALDTPRTTENAPAGAETSDSIMICDLDHDVCTKYEEEYDHISIAKSIEDLADECDVIVAGVKPQGMAPVMEKIAEVYRPDKLLISMAAGISIDWIKDHLGDDARIIRIMPNTPAQVGEAMIALCRGDNVEDDDMQKAVKVLGPAGVIEEVTEDQIDCVIGVSGSSPAYTYMYIEALVDAAVANGMEEDKARVFAAQSVLGAAKMVLESPESISQLRINVCSPGGTTIEAVNKLEENGFRDKIAEGLQAAVDRSIEMTKEAKK